ncbi:MAG: carboxylating nicotinate-nucleotide diphosphorylase [Devosia nanyangense]|uniref:Probable nicotinate-nucleotide pyrophosphorylase [carboxylating] n=1 Tax=Paradevosia shaoguanensis TaxID=1335043 RepID=A0AA41UCH6_9HYPH|nr:carboxylating nicotinate-nucleotide diphosphorylase [Paradevosia shaoguanensis]MBI4047360.1 carboxylating nicotinate-nucleotide diphosphorylase [Devosia nanyangense]MCF1741831.1 carboxylating nicotinate-nucleotide diphosphorylase [Paradevosia shaoguanensis]MCI0126314.1 carboxylating nicotinate-nucleotide diphosphorylase [Paradevosia shaoguanensis]
MHIITSPVAELPRPLVDKAVLAALEEDLGLAGDLTSQATLPPQATAAAVLSVREAGVIAGLALPAAAFRLIGDGLTFEASVADGDTVEAGTVVARVWGNARLMMMAERVALNFINHLSGIATLTRTYARELEGTSTRICDTRKTTPGLRAFEKYAVRCGGGANHRYALDDAILIKDNHIAVAGGVTAAFKAARAFAGHLVAIEIEVETLEQLEEALAAGAKIVLLDNMDDATLRKAVELTAGRATLEASGGVKLERLKAIAATGVDYISTSQITMSARPLDLGLDIEIGH